MIIAPFAGIALLVDLVFRRRSFRPAWFRLLICVIGALLSLINAFVHSRDGYTAVVPSGLTLSAIVAVIVVVLGCYGWNLSVRRKPSPPNPPIIIEAPSPSLGSHSCPFHVVAVFCTLASALALAGCDRKGGDPSKQIGANPVLPEPNQYLLPPMRIAPVVQWGSATPTVAPGLKVEALATGFIHPRTIYVLPNGDILVVESNGPKAPVNRPKDLIMKWVEAFGGGDAPGGNRITLLRHAEDAGRSRCSAPSSWTI